jgi:hypothetical protein
LPFVVHMMSVFLQSRISNLFLNHEFHEAYVKSFLHYIVWKSNKRLSPYCMPFVRHLTLSRKNPDLTSFSFLTSLYIHYTLQDYSPLTNMTTLRWLSLYVTNTNPTLHVPSSLTSLSLQGDASYNNMDWNVPHLQEFNCHIRIPLPFSALLTCLTCKDLSYIPSTVVKLRFLGVMSDLLCVPTSVTQLELEQIATPWPMFPSHLSFLRLNVPHPNPITLPMHITELQLGHEFNSPIAFYPQTLKKIRFGDEFNQPIFNLPKQVEDLELGYHFNQGIPSLRVKKLILCCFQIQWIDECPNLHWLEVRFSAVWQKVETVPLCLQRLDIRSCVVANTFSFVPFSTLVIVNQCRNHHYVRMRCAYCIDEEFSCQRSQIQ